MFLAIVALFSVVLVVESQLAGFGYCPSVNVVNNFNASAYLGKWYEQKKYFNLFQAGGRCVTATYSARSDGKIGVLNSQICPLGTVQSIEGYATLANPSVAKLSVTFPSVPATGGAPYWVLSTDYNNYAVVWSCTNILFYNAQFLWILTRARNPTQAVLNDALSVVTNNKLNTNFLMTTDQSNCPA